MFRRRRTDRRTGTGPGDRLAHVRLDGAPARWRGAVRIALEHRSRFLELSALVDDGPVADRLDTIAERVDRGVLAIWDLVQRGSVAERALEATSPRDTAERLKAARRELADAPEGAHDTIEARIEALAAAHAAAQQLWNTVEDLENRLHLVDARLGAVVAQAAQLATGTVFSDDIDRAERELDEAVGALDATRQALDEVSRL